VRANLALRDQAPLRLVDELNRVFDGQNVRIARLVDVDSPSPPASSIYPSRSAGDEINPPVISDSFERCRDAEVGQTSDL